METCKYCNEQLESQEEIKRGSCDYCERHKQLIGDIQERQSIYVDMKKFDGIFASDGDFVEATTWSNGEGVDIYIYLITGKKKHFH